MIATTIDQSKRLLKAGIDPQTADMYWTNIVETADEGGYFIKEREQVFHLEIGCSSYDKNIIPAWSLSALLELLYSKYPLYLIGTAWNVERLFEDIVNNLCKEK